MTTHWTYRIWRQRWAACAAGLGLCLGVLAAEVTGGAEPASRTTNEAASDAQQAWRSYLQLQEQLRAAMQAAEQSRKESEGNARRTAEAVAERLKMLEDSMSNQRAVEQTYAGQRERDLETMQSTNRSLLIVAGAMAVVSVLAMFFTVWFQMRAVNRLAEIATLHRDAMLLNPHPLPALGAGGGTALAVLHPAEVSGQRLLGVVDQLERKLRELENVAQAAVPAPKAEGASSGGNGAHTAPAPEGETAAGEVLSEAQGRLNMLLGKGQSHLNLGQMEQAMACFDEALALAPNSGDALMKKGHALERLQKFPEALECYDRAIALDETLTLAYVYKGGVFNHLERYDEALACYEKALRAQQKAGVPLTAAAQA